MSKEITPFCKTIWIQDNQNCFSLCVLRGSFCADITIPRFQNLCGAVTYGPATKVPDTCRFSYISTFSDLLAPEL